jgi:hypothetical protein
MEAALPDAYDSYDYHLRRPRLNINDIIVLVGAVVAFLVGWAIKDYLDDRTRTAQIDTVKVAYPRDWLSFPTTEPEVFRAISNDDGDTSLFLSKLATAQTDVLQAVTTNNSNPARDEVGYGQLGNQTDSVDGNDAVRTDYTYVITSVGGSSVPAVIRGRQFSWIKNGELFTFALEGPEDSWDRLRSEADRLVDMIDTGA